MSRQRAVDDARSVVVLVATSELALLSHRRWLGQGKWLLRRLRAHDPVDGRLTEGFRA